MSGFMTVDFFVAKNSSWLKRFGYFNILTLPYFSMMTGVLWLEKSFLLLPVFLLVTCLILFTMFAFIRNAFRPQPVIGKKYAIWQIISFIYFVYIWSWSPVMNLIYR